MTAESVGLWVIRESEGKVTHVTIDRFESEKELHRLGSGFTLNFERWARA